jgi:ribosomal protein S12 methylthiotransferase
MNEPDPTNSSLPIVNAAGQPPVVAFVALGCAKNLVDSEKMLGQLAEAGCIISADESAADTVVVNTCGFLNSSRDEAIEILSELAERKRAGDLQRIVVAGCLVQRDGEALREAVPEVDALVGVNNRNDIVRSILPLSDKSRDPVDLYLGDYHGQAWSDLGRLRLTPEHYAYMRVSEGCNQKCTFCTIPSIRGPMHSKTPADLLAEGRELLADGARELILIGQDTTSYGMDLPAGADGRPIGLEGLLRTLNDGLVEARWIRLMYVYPSIFTDSMIDAIASSERVVKYIDIPLQHISDRVLKLMRRQVTRAQTLALLAKLRERIPGVTIRTTFIVGFPGESEADFEELLSFVQGFGFDAAGAFPYSLEPETPAGKMPNQVPAELIAERYDRFMLTQQAVTFERIKSRVGQVFDVVVDGADEEGTLIARHAGQAPEVDSVCVLEKSQANAGDLVSVKCTGVDGYDLVVEPVSRALPMI